MKTGIENIFLAYANLPPKEMPGNLKKVYEVARDYFEIHQSTHDVMLKLFDLVKYFDENEDKKITSIDKDIISMQHYRAFWSVERCPETRCISCRELTLSHLNEWDQFDIKRPPIINT